MKILDIIHLVNASLVGARVRLFTVKDELKKLTWIITYYYSDGREYPFMIELASDHNRSCWANREDFEVLP